MQNEAFALLRLIAKLCPGHYFYGYAVGLTIFLVV